MDVYFTFKRLQILGQNITLFSSTNSTIFRTKFNIVLVFQGLLLFVTFSNFNIRKWFRFLTSYHGQSMCVPQCEQLLLFSLFHHFLSTFEPSVFIISRTINWDFSGLPPTGLFIFLGFRFSCICSFSLWSFFPMFLTKCSPFLHLLVQIVQYTLCPRSHHSTFLRSAFQYFVSPSRRSYCQSLLGSPLVPIPRRSC